MSISFVLVPIIKFYAPKMSRLHQEIKFLTMNCWQYIQKRMFEYAKETQTIEFDCEKRKKSVTGFILK